MKSPTEAEKLLADSNLNYWQALFGTVEEKHLGSSNTCVAETFLKNFISNNAAGVKCAVSRVIEDCFVEMNAILAASENISDEDLYDSFSSPNELLESDAVKVFGFLVDFVSTARAKGIKVGSIYDDQLISLKPTIIEHQKNFEAYTIARISRALEGERGKALDKLRALDI